MFFLGFYIRYQEYITFSKQLGDELFILGHGVSFHMKFISLGSSCSLWLFIVFTDNRICPYLLIVSLRPISVPYGFHRVKWVLPVAFWLPSVKRTAPGKRYAQAAVTSGCDVRLAVYLSPESLDWFLLLRFGFVSDRKVLHILEVVLGTASVEREWGWGWGVRSFGAPATLGGVRRAVLRPRRINWNNPAMVAGNKQPGKFNISNEIAAVTVAAAAAAAAVPATKKEEQDEEWWRAKLIMTQAPKLTSDSFTEGFHLVLPAGTKHCLAWKWLHGHCGVLLVSFENRPVCCASKKVVIYSPVCWPIFKPITTACIPRFSRSWPILLLTRLHFCLQF